MLQERMNHHHDSREKIYLIFILQGWFSVCACTDWSFTFPESMRVLNHSSVTIPCTFTSPENYKDINIIWFSDNKQVFNSENPSAVLQEYKGRTFLVGNQTNSCSLRINDVTEEAYYYPGISAEINSDALNKTRVKVILTDWTFTFPKSIIALRGSCVEIPCFLPQQDGHVESSLIWYSDRFSSYHKIFNGRNLSDVESDYRGRTSLVGKGTNSCSLRINNVNNIGIFFPGISTEINSYKLSNRKTVDIKLTDAVPMSLTIGSDYIVEGITVSVYCAIKHTCASNPPSVEWNKAVRFVSERHEDLSGGYWRLHSEIIYSPSYRDHNKRLECNAKFPNGKRFCQYTTLNIKFSPKSTTIQLHGSYNMTEGDEVTLQCITQANPPATSYTWFKGSGNSAQRLNETTEDTITFNLSWENEIYYCSARNDLGVHSSAPIHLSVKSDYTAIYLVFGIICLLLSLSIGYIYFRKRKSQRIFYCTANQREAANPQESTYADLDITDVSPDYDTFKAANPRDSTYADLDKTDVSPDYDTFMTASPQDATYTSLQIENISPDYDELK